MLQMSESKVLSKCGRRVDDDVCMELSFHLINLRRNSGKEETIYEKFLTDLRTQMSAMFDRRAENASSLDILAKLMTAVRDMDVLSMVCRSRPRRA